MKVNFNFYKKKSIASRLTLIILPFLIALNLIFITRYFLSLEKIEIKNLEISDLQNKSIQSYQSKIELSKAQKVISYLNFPWISLLENLGKIKSTQPHIFILSINADVNRKQIDITGEAETFSDLNSFILKLKESKLFKDAVLISQQSNQSSQGIDKQTFLIKLFVI